MRGWRQGDAAGSYPDRGEFDSRAPHRSLQRPTARDPVSEAGEEGSTPSAASTKTWTRSSRSMKTLRDQEDSSSSRSRSTDGAVSLAMLSIIPGQHGGHARVCFTQRSRFDSFPRSSWYVSSVAEQGPVRPEEEGSIPSRIASPYDVPVLLEAQAGGFSIH